MVQSTKAPKANLCVLLFPHTGVIWPIVGNKLLNEKGISIGWTLRIIAFMQLGLMISATLLIQPRFPRSTVREPLHLKRYFTDKRTVLFTVGLVIMNLGIYVPWVSRSHTNDINRLYLLTKLTLSSLALRSFSSRHMPWRWGCPHHSHSTTLRS